MIKKIICSLVLSSLVCTAVEPLILTHVESADIQDALYRGILSQMIEDIEQKDYWHALKKLNILLAHISNVIEDEGDHAHAQDITLRLLMNALIAQLSLL